MSYFAHMCINILVFVQWNDFTHNSSLKIPIQRNSYLMNNKITLNEEDVYNTL